MESSTPSPKKRQRRWLIVSVVIVLVSAGVWWFAPRRDTSFVGKWRTPDGQTWTLHANGVAVWQSAGQSAWTLWDSADDTIRFGRISGTKFDELRVLLVRVIQRVTGQTALPLVPDWRVSAVTPDSILLQNTFIDRTGFAEPVVLTRIPE